MNFLGTLPIETVKQKNALSFVFVYQSKGLLALFYDACCILQSGRVYQREKLSGKSA